MKKVPVFTYDNLENTRRSRGMMDRNSAYKFFYALQKESELQPVQMHENEDEIVIYHN